MLADCLSPEHSGEVFFFFNDTATTEIYTLSLHDALPISRIAAQWPIGEKVKRADIVIWTDRGNADTDARSEEHTSELQSQSNLVCRLLLEKKHSFHARTFVNTFEAQHLPLKATDTSYILT